MTQKSNANELSEDTYISTAECMQLGIPTESKKSKYLLIKRFTDFIVSLCALLVLFPLLLVIAVIICLDSPGPALYRQKRVGRRGNYFQIYKFRTMYAGTPDLPTSEMQMLPSAVTKFGKLLRQTSVDEVPQLFNILKGEMSIVGPRPALYNQEELIAERLQTGVLEFLPGITGWAQVNGRDELSDSVKVQLDKWYVDHWHYFLDWRIIFATVKAVLSRRGTI